MHIPYEVRQSTVEIRQSTYEVRHWCVEIRQSTYEKRQYGNTTVNLRNPARFDTAKSDNNRHHATPSDSQHTNIRKSDIQPAKSDCTCYGATPNVGTYYRHFHRMPSTLTDLSHRIHQPPTIASQPDARQPSINHPPPNNKQPTTNAKTLGARPEEPDRAPSAMKGRKGENRERNGGGPQVAYRFVPPPTMAVVRAGNETGSGPPFQLLFSYIQLFFSCIRFSVRRNAHPRPPVSETSGQSAISVPQPPSPHAAGRRRRGS